MHTVLHVRFGVLSDLVNIGYGGIYVSHRYYDFPTGTQLHTQAMLDNVRNLASV